MSFVSDLPPRAYLEIILNTCQFSDVAQTYIVLWDKKDSKNRVSVILEDIKNEFLISPTKFLNHIRQISRQKLLNVARNDKRILVELVAFDEDFDAEEK